MSKSEVALVQNLMTQGPFTVHSYWILFYVLNITNEREHKFNA
ncbi:BhlA/UviB family holin-like peptide [Bacillus safensis]|nr:MULTISPECIES: BhlA/UviB family holin-like peptide [Bacillus]MDP4565730.1 BhlA/UviB family holin-like peptide [Bacillus safensis]MEC0921070.1 BhlA/UviB family holin-like peptide [Bacillus safensis]MEC0994314.1 BhlA/UviB family holin-like peptide [Bacillus safensis]MEC0999137.1 BhlA/UviB family holin-like peptide [Bacillus safensis]MEC4589108.1 BhlA/UviB family holin-like peptide [Bacillus safensis]